MKLRSECGVLLIVNKTNQNSLAAIAGSLDDDRWMFRPDIHVSLPDDVLGSQIISLSKKYSKLVVLFSFMTFDVMEVHSRLSGLQQMLKDRSIENCYFIAGGAHPSGDWESTMAMGFDAAVIGEGEAIIRNLIAAVNGKQDFSTIANAATKTKDAWVAPRLSTNRIDLDSFCPIVPRLSLVGPIEISRGCPCGCYFCQVSNIMGRTMRHRSIESVLDIISAYRHHRRPFVRFISTNAFAYGSETDRPHPEMIEALVRKSSEMLNGGRIFFGSFPSEARPEWVERDVFKRINPMLANRDIVIGAQSGSSRMLSIMNRNHTVDDIIRAAKITLEFDLLPIIDFIFGLPDETPSDIEMTLKLIEQLIGMGCRIHSHAFIPLPGSKFQNSPPAHIDGKYLQILEKYEGKGNQFGHWRRQKKLAVRITRYLSDLKEIAKSATITSREEDFLLCK